MKISSHGKFFIAVEHMRESQKVHLRQKTSFSFAAAKKCEEVVDAYILNERSKMSQHNQPKLF
jgi:hypothetical protein